MSYQYYLNIIKKIFLSLFLLSLCLNICACSGGGGQSVSNNIVDPTPNPIVAPKAIINGYLMFGEVYFGQFVNDALVELKSINDYSKVLKSTHSIDGKFTFNDINPGKYIITAAVIKDNFIFKNEAIVNIEAGRYDYNLPIIELIKTYDLPIVVLDENKMPITNAKVTLDDYNILFTDNNGNVVFKNIPNKQCKLSVYKDGFDTYQSYVLSSFGKIEIILLKNNNTTNSLGKIYAVNQELNLSNDELITKEDEIIEIAVTLNYMPNTLLNPLSFKWHTDIGQIIEQNEITTESSAVSIIKYKATNLNWFDNQVYQYDNIKVECKASNTINFLSSNKIKILKKNSLNFKITSYPSSTFIKLNEEFKYQITLSQPGNYKYEILKGPSELQISNLGLVTFKPTNLGNYDVILRVTELTGNYFQIQNFVITCSEIISELALSDKFSITKLKPQNYSTIIVKNFQNTEQLVIIGYNVDKSSTSFKLNAFEPTKLMLSNIFSDVNRFSLNKNMVFNAEITLDMIMRENEKKTAKLYNQTLNQLNTYKAPSYNTNKFTLGEIHEFYCLNSLTWPPYEKDWTRVSAKLRAIGNHCYIFEDVAISFPYMSFSESEIERIKNVFDNEVYPNITSTFGSEPNPGIDNDSKIFILFSPNVNKQGAAGYFDSTNQLTQQTLDSSSQYNKNSYGYKYYSNEKEMFYMATLRHDQNKEQFLINTLGVLAHEFQHMINWNYHLKSNPEQLEESWVNEGLSQVAQDVAGYGYQYGTLSFVIEPFLKYPEMYSLTNFQFGLGYYGVSYLFMRYLVDRGVSPKSLVQSNYIGKANIENAIKSIGIANDFNEIFEDFITTLYLSNTGITSDKRYNYSSINIRSIQKDGTKLNGLQVNDNILFPTSWDSFSFNEYAITAIRCKTNVNCDYRLNFNSTNDNKIGYVILRIKN